MIACYMFIMLPQNVYYVTTNHVLMFLSVDVACRSSPA